MIWRGCSRKLWQRGGAGDEGIDDLFDAAAAGADRARTAGGDRGGQRGDQGAARDAPAQALEGFLRKTGLTREQLEDRDGVLFARIERPGRSASEVLAEAVAAIVRDFPWPKSMRWGGGAQPLLRWVRPLHGIVALLGEDIVPVEIDGIAARRGDGRPPLPPSRARSPSAARTTMPRNCAPAMSSSTMKSARRLSAKARKRRRRAPASALSRTRGWWSRMPG